MRAVTRVFCLLGLLKTFQAQSIPSNDTDTPGVIETLDGETCAKQWKNNEMDDIETGCIKEPSDYAAWCGTAVDNDTMVYTSWDYCYETESCGATLVTQQTCQNFTYRITSFFGLIISEEWNLEAGACTYLGSPDGRPWCATVENFTIDDSPEDYGNDTWDYCDVSCGGAMNEPVEMSDGMDNSNDDAVGTSDGMQDSNNGEMSEPEEGSDSNNGVMNDSPMPEDTMQDPSVNGSSSSEEADDAIMGGISEDDNQDDSNPNINIDIQINGQNYSVNVEVEGNKDDIGGEDVDDEDDDSSSYEGSSYEDDGSESYEDSYEDDNYSSSNETYDDNNATSNSSN